MPWQAELPFFVDKPAEGETSRTVALGDRIVPYLLRRARRRTIGLTIDHRGLRVGAPHRTPLSEVEALILRHGDWVAQKLDEWRKRHRPAPLQIADGAHVPYLGGWLEVRLSGGNNRVVWADSEPPTLAPATLTLFLRAPADAATLLRKALQQKALDHFGPRLAHHAARFAVAVPPLRLSSARTRWGSCSAKSGIRLNWRLIHCAPHVIDYVIVHELAHLREMNHGPRFWAIVESHCPDYRAIRTELRQQASSHPAW